MVAVESPLLTGSSAKSMSRVLRLRQCEIFFRKLILTGFQRVLLRSSLEKLKFNLKLSKTKPYFNFHQKKSPENLDQTDRHTKNKHVLHIGKVGRRLSKDLLETSSYHNSIP
jgi:hypothetical protein